MLSLPPVSQHALQLGRCLVLYNHTAPPVTSAASVCLWVQNGGEDVTQSKSILSYEAKEKQEVWGCRGRIILCCLFVSLTSSANQRSATGLGQPWCCYHDPLTSARLASDLKDSQAVMWLNVELNIWTVELLISRIEFWSLQARVWSCNNNCSLAKKYYP